MYKVFRGVIGQSVSLCDSFVNRPGGAIVNSFLSWFGESVFQKFVECPVYLTHISRAGATSLFWKFDSDSEAESAFTSSKRRTEGRTPGHRGSGKRGWS